MTSTLDGARIARTWPEAPTSFLPDRLPVRAWRDPVVDSLGHDPRSAYVERFWLPVLGPSTVWLLRRLAFLLEDSPEGAEVNTAELARQLGIGERTGPSAPFCRTVKRCVDFQMARWEEPALAVRRLLPPLANRHLRRLPEALRLEHEALASSRPASPDEKLLRHGRHLAVSLLDYGEDQSAAESQLVRWGFERPLAQQCASFAAIVISRRRAAASTGT